MSKKKIDDNGMAPITELKKASTESKKREGRNQTLEDTIVVFNDNEVEDTPQKRRERALAKFRTSQSARTLMTGHVGGLRVVEINGKQVPCAIINEEGFQVLIPADRFSKNINEFDPNDESYDTNIHFLIRSYIGSEVDYIVTSIPDEKGDIVIGDRIMAMDKLKKEYYIDEAILKPGKLVNARVVISKRPGIVVEAAGIEFFLPNKELKYTWLNDATEFKPNGSNIVVLIKDVQYTEVDGKKDVSVVKGSAKEAFPDQRIEAFDRYQLDDVTFGDVVGITQNGIFVNLGEIDCLCLFPKFTEIPEIGDRVTIKITRKLEDRLFINGLILAVNS